MIYDMKDFLQAAVLMVVMVMSVMFSVAVHFFGDAVLFPMRVRFRDVAVHFMIVFAMAVPSMIVSAVAMPFMIVPAVAVPFMDMLPVAVKILHIMIMVLMRLIQHHIKITYIQP